MTAGGMEIVHTARSTYAMLTEQEGTLIFKKYARAHIHKHIQADRKSGREGERALASPLPLHCLDVKQ